jgi:molecular chaperone Hsp33
MEKSRMIRGTSKSARFFLTDTTELVKEAQKLQNFRSNCSNIIWKVTYCNCNDGSRLEK